MESQSREELLAGSRESERSLSGIDEQYWQKVAKLCADLRALKNQELAVWGEGISTRRYHGGFSYTDEDKPGEYWFHAVSDRGISIYRGAQLVEDPQSGVCHDEVATDPSLSTIPEEDRDQEEDFDRNWAVLHDAQSQCAEKIDAIQICLDVDEDKTAGFIVDELCREDLPQDWRDALVLFAETAQYREDPQRDRLWRRLLEIALTLRGKPDEGLRPVVSSAIRTLASMIPEEHVNKLLPLLEPPNPIETRLVTLQGIAAIFEVRPPADVDAVAPLADRVYELARKFLDRDWLIAGEKAAIGLNATHALAAMGDGRLVNCVSAIVDLNEDWFALQLIQDFESLSEAWSTDNKAKAHSAFGLVQTQLTRLKSNTVEID